jgi:hypothetical protein
MSGGREIQEMSMRWREFGEDFGWLLAVLLFPLALPIGVLVFLYLLGQRLVRGRRQPLTAS